MSKATAARLLRELPNRWWFGALWIAALAAMAAGAVRAA